MPFVVHCGQCQKRYDVADELAGRTFRCKECGAPIRTQAKPVVADAPVPPKAKAPSAKPPATVVEKPKTPAREKPVEKAKPARREEVAEELEVLEEDDGFLDDEPQRDTRRSRSREPSPSRERSRRSKSRGSKEGLGISPKWIIVGGCLLFVGVLVWWVIVRPILGVWRQFEVAANRWVELPGDACKIKLPSNMTNNFVMHPGSSAVTYEMSATTTTSELQCITVKWNQSVGAEMDSGRIFDAVRESWARPWGAIEKEEPLDQQGIAGRAFRGSAEGRQSFVRAFANRHGLIVLRIRNRPGQQLAEQDRDEFFGSLQFKEDFAKAAPAGSRIESPSPAGKALAQKTETAPPRAAAVESQPPISNNSTARSSAPAKETIAEVPSIAGAAPRVTREFRVAAVATNVTAVVSKTPDRNSAIQKLEWNVTVDPPSEPIVYDTSRPLNVMIPAERLPQSAVVVFGAPPSPCVLVGADGQERSVWNLATRQKLGTIPARKLAHTPIALSPDGKWIAAPSLETNGALTIWDVAAGKSRAEWPNAQFGSAFRFLSPTRLLNEGPNRLRVHDVSDGKSVCEINPPSSPLDIAASPGGHTLAVLFSKELQIFDAESGRVLGRMSFGFPVSAGHLAFSPDGTVLALAAQRVSQYRLAEIQVADGRIGRDFVSQQLGDASFQHQHFGLNARVLQGFPGNGGWLFGDKHFVRSELEGIAWTFETLHSFTHRHQTAITATENSIIRLAPDPKGGKLIFESIGTRALEATKGDVQVAVDALLPKLTPADWSQAVEVLPASQPKWNVPRRELSDTELSTPTLTFELGSRFTRGAALTGKKQLAVMCQPAGDSSSGNTKGAKTANVAGVNFTLELYDMVSDAKKSNPAPAKPTKQVAIPFPCDLIDVSPSARFALVRAAQWQAGVGDGDRQGQLSGRLDVIDIPSGKHLVGWRPFFDLFDQAIVQQAAFIDDEHVLTLSQAASSNQGSVLAMWKLPECRAEYVIQGISTRTLSPDRRVLGISRQLDSLRERSAAPRDEPRGLFLLDAVSGATLGYLAGGTSVTHAAFHPREPRLFALTQQDAVDIAIEWDLQSGKILREFPLPSESSMANNNERQLAWTATDQLLVNGRTILDPKRQIYSAQLRMQDVVYLPQSFDSRAWFLGEINRSNHLIGLGVTELPDAKMNTTIQLAMPKPDLILKPGTKVGLSFQIASLPPDVAAEVQKRVRDQFELMQLRIADGSEITIQVSTVEEAGGALLYVRDPSPFGNFGRRREESVQTQTATERRIVCRFQVLRNNKLEKEFRTISSNALWFVTTRDNQSVQQVIDESMQSGAKRYLLETRLPPYLFSDEWRKGLTGWQLSPKGIEQQQFFGVPR